MVVKIQGVMEISVDCVKTQLSLNLMKSVNVNPNFRIDPSEIDSPLTPTFISPRLAPFPPQGNKSFKASFHTVFRTQPKPLSPSLKSKSDTASTITPSDENNNARPYSSVYMPPIPVVKNHSVVEDDDECPVCLEPLSFSFRLPGEKPHIVPECGHALHEVSQSYYEQFHSHISLLRPALPLFMVHLQINKLGHCPENLILAFVAFVDGL